MFARLNLRNLTLKTYVMWAAIMVSLVLAATSWAHVSHLKHSLAGLAVYGIGLVLTEICFTAGAVIMATVIAAELSTELAGHWVNRIAHARRNLRRHAVAAVGSRWFGFGFWLNFAGAVGTSLLLIAGVFSVVRWAGIGLALLLALDLVATFAWRVPVHLSRRKLLHGARQN